MLYYHHNSMTKGNQTSKKARICTLKLHQGNFWIWWSNHLNHHKKKNKQHWNMEVHENNLQTRRPWHLQKIWQVYLMMLERTRMKHSFHWNYLLTFIAFSHYINMLVLLTIRTLTWNIIRMYWQLTWTIRMYFQFFWFLSNVFLQ